MRPAQCPSTTRILTNSVSGIDPSQPNPKNKQDSFGFKLTLQSLISQVVTIVSQVEQARMSMDSWYKKHSTQLSEIEIKLKDILVQLNEKTQLLGKVSNMRSDNLTPDTPLTPEEIGMKLKKNAVELFKEAIQNNLDYFKQYLEFLYGQLKLLPDNQAVIFHLELKPLDQSDHFMLIQQVENRNLPFYNKMLAQLNDDYLALTSVQGNYTDLVFFSNQGLRHILRYPKSYKFAFQHTDRFMFENDVFSILDQFKHIQTLNQEIFCYCGYDSRTLLVGLNNHTIGVYVFIDGQYRDIKQIKISPAHIYGQIIAIHHVKDNIFMIAIGKPKMSVRLVELDTHKWCQISSTKICQYSGSVVRIHQSNKTKFVVQSQKKLINFDAETEGFDKNVSFKNEETDMIVFPHYDYFHLPYVIGDNNVIFDIKQKVQIGKFIDLNDDQIVLGFTNKNAQMITTCGVEGGLKLYSLCIK